MKYNSSYRNKALYFFIPFALFLTVCIILKITPFGDRSLLISDMWNQYADYFGYYKSIFSGENDIFYTFSKSLGGDMTGFMAYYLMSPLNLIFLLVKNENIVYAVTWLVAIKIGLCGLFCGIYLENIKPNAKYIWMFSASYALMSYNIAYAFNTMWTDGVYILPLVALGIEKIIDRKSSVLYIFSLAYALIVNYYIGYMICIFSVVYFLYRRIVLWDKMLMNNFKSAVNFGISSLLAGGLSAVMLIPVFKSLAGTKAVFNPDILKFEIETPIWKVLLKLFTGTVSTNEIICGLPNIYCGLLMTVLVIVYFFCKSVPLKEKILSAAVIAFMVCSFCVTAINLAWHGFNAPICFPYRYSFVASFFIIYLAFSAWDKLSENKNIFVYLIPAAIVMVTLVIMKPYISDAEFISQSSVMAEMIAVAALIVLFFAYTLLQTKYKNIIIIFVVIIQMTSVVFNGISMKNLLVAANNSSVYTEQTVCAQAGVEAVKEYDDSFYRMEKNFNRTHNDSMQFAYNGITHFSSTEKQDVIYYVGDLGFSHCYAWSLYGNGSTVAAESFLGLKYIVADDKLMKPYNVVEHIGDVNIYHNQYALPIGFVCDKGVEDAVVHTGSKFRRQNEIYSVITGEETEIFYPVQSVEVLYENIEAMQEDNRTYLKKIDDNKEAFVQYNIKAASEDMIYIYLDSRSNVAAELFVNDVYCGNYLDYYNSNIYSIGEYAEGEEIRVKIKLNSHDMYLFAEAFYHEDLNVIEKCVDKLSAKSENTGIEKISSSNVIWKGSLKEDGVLVFTIPNEPGWHAYVDGQKTETMTVIDKLIGISLSEGEHNVEIRYIPVGLKTGAAVTVVSLFVCIVLFLIKRLRSRVK